MDFPIGFVWRLRSLCAYSLLSGNILGGMCILRVLLQKIRLMNDFFGIILIPWVYYVVSGIINVVVVSIGVVLVWETLKCISILLTSGMWSRLYDRSTYVSYKTPLLLFLIVCSAIHCGWLFYLCRTMWVKDYWIGLQILQVLPLLMLFVSTMTRTLFTFANQPHHHIHITEQQGLNEGTIARQFASQWIYHDVPLVVYFFTMVYFAYTCSFAWDMPLINQIVILVCSMSDVVNHVYTAKRIHDIGRYIDRSCVCKEESTEFDPAHSKQVNSVVSDYSEDPYTEYRRFLCVLTSGIPNFNEDGSSELVLPLMKE